MRKRVYIETTIVSYWTAKASRDVVIAGHQEATRGLWPLLGSQFEGYVSALVHEEAKRGDPVQAEKRLAAIEPFSVLEIDDEAQELARRLMAGSAIPEEHPEDALHIALAAVNGMDVLITWNFTHINNPFTCLMIRQVIDNQGYEPPAICSPDELLESDQ